MGGILVSFWDGLFSGAMLVSGSVTVKEDMFPIDYGDVFIDMLIYPRDACI